MPFVPVSGDDAAQRLLALPANVCVYGPPGTRKTTLTAQAFVDAARGVNRSWFIQCEDGALKPVGALASRGMPVPSYAVDPQTGEPKTVKCWADYVEQMSWLFELRRAGQCPFTAVVMDTVSTFTEYLHREFSAPGGMGAVPGLPAQNSKNKYAIWIRLRDALFTVREWSRAIGLHSVLIAHEVTPGQRTEEGVIESWIGGPLLQPKTMIERYHGSIDTILRVARLPSVPGNAGGDVFFTGGTEWPTGYGMPPADMAKYRTKNRDGINLAVVPADLRAYLLSRQPPYPI